jgi:hypothetical protein
MLIQMSEHVFNDRPHESRHSTLFAGFSTVVDNLRTDESNCRDLSSNGRSTAVPGNSKVHTAPVVPVAPPEVANFLALRATLAFEFIQ